MMSPGRLLLLSTPSTRLKSWTSCSTHTHTHITHRGVVVVERLAPNDVEDVAAFLDELHWPVIHADVRSGLRDVDVVVRRPNAVLEALKELRPDCVLQLGAAPAFAPGDARVAGRRVLRPKCAEGRGRAGPFKDRRRLRHVC